ncbi:NAD(P)-binding protein [Chloroflexota bacterium]
MLWYYTGEATDEKHDCTAEESFFLCGYGDVGREIARFFSQDNVPLVVIDKDGDSIANAEKDDVLYIEADASDDEVLKEDGIEQARTLVAALGSDADNTYITLSARVLRPDLFIEARASAMRLRLN